MLNYIYVTIHIYIYIYSLFYTGPIAQFHFSKYAAFCQLTVKLYMHISQGLPQKVSVRSSDYCFIANLNKTFLVSISK